MKNLITKIISILMIMLMLINSSLMLVISTAIDAVQNIIDESKINAIYELNLEKYVNYKVGDSTGVMIQTYFKTGIEYEKGQEYKPLNSTGIILNTPKINDEFPERVEVVTKSTKATNGDDNGKDSNYVYDNKTGKIKLVTINKADDKGNIYSENVADARDEYQIVLYYSSNCYDEKTTKRELDFSGKIQINVKNEDDEFKVQKDITQKFEVAENISGLVSTNVTTSDIYNGYIVSNSQNDTSYRTEYTENMKIQVSYKEIADEVKIATKNLFINSKDKENETADIVYKSSKISKDEVLNELGENGNLQILDKDGNVLGEITKDSETDENGYVTVNYENEPTELTIKLSKPEKIGDINIQNIKQIKESMRNIDNKKIEVKDNISCSNKVKETTKVIDEITKEEKDVETEKQVEVYNFENANNVDIKDAVTDVELTVNNNSWTNKVQNDVVFTTTLVTSGSENKLFNNPTVDIKLPAEVEKIVLGEVSLLYDNDLKIKSTSIINMDGCKVIRISLEGTQKSYNQNNLVKGANIVIPASIILKKDVSSTNTNIEYSYVNDKETNKNNVPVEIVSIADEEKNQSVVSAMTNSESEETAQPVVQAANVDLDKISVEYKAQLGNKDLNDGDSVHEGEYIKYIAKIKNNSGENVSGLNVIASVPEGTTYVSVETKKITEEERQNKINDECRLTEDINKNEERNIITLAAEEEKELSFYVKIKDIESGQNSKNISSNLKISVNEKEKNIGMISNIVNKADIVMGVTARETYRDKGIWLFEINVTNRKNETINNVNIELDLEGKFVLSDDDENEGVVQEDKKMKFTIDSIPANDVYSRYVFARANTIQDVKTSVNVNVMAIYNEQKYYANPNIQNIKILNLKITQTCEKEGEEIKYGDEVEYVFTVKNESDTLNEFNINFYDYLDKNMKPISVQYENFYMDPNTNTFESSKATTEEKLSDKQNPDDGEAIWNLQLYIPNGNEVTIKIKATPRMLFERTEVVNYATIEYNYNGKYVKTSNSIKNVIIPYGSSNPDNPNPDNPDPDNPNPDNPDPDNPDPDNPDPDNPDPDNPDNSKTYSISGVVWNDENKNGSRENEEKLLSGITVKLFDINTNSIVSIDGEKQIKTTDESGKYQFTGIKKGSYIVLFEYDTENYKLTTYKSSGINEMLNSDVIDKTVNIDGVEKNVAVTDNININDTDYANIDMGLIQNGKFDLSLNKSITGVSVDYNGQKEEYSYNDTKIAKVEIPSKKVNNAVVTIEYKIEVENEGNVDAVVDSIVDYKPDGLEFDKKLNPDWTIDSNNNVKYFGLAGKKLKSGESTSIILYLTKKLSSDNMGTFVNSAEILKSSNTEGLNDIDSIEGNKNKEEDDYSEAQVVISVKTGAILYAGIMLGILVILGIIIIGIKKNKINLKKIKRNCLTYILAFTLTIYVLSGVVKAELCWDTLEEYWEENKGLTSYTVTENGKELTFWTHNYKSYNSTKENNVLYCTDDAAMGTIRTDKKDSVWQQFNYYNTNEITDLFESGWSYSYSGEDASISEKELDDKGNYFSVGSSDYIIGPYAVNYNGSLTGWEVIGKKSDGTTSKIESAIICDKNGNGTNITSGNEFYIKIPASSEYVEVCKITVNNGTTKKKNGYYVKTYEEVWKTNDKKKKLNGDASSKIPQILHKPIKKEDSSTNDVPSNDSVDIAVAKKIVGSIKITKKDTDTEGVLSGAKFKVTGPNNYSKEFTTNDKGEISISNLPLGTYTITETEAPTNYKLNLQDGTTKTVTVTTEKTATGAFTNKQYGNVTVTKKDEDSNSTSLNDIPLKGIQFKLYVMKNNKKQYLQTGVTGKYSYDHFNVSENKKSQAQTFTTDSNAQFTVSNLPVYNGKNKIKYYIEEYALPDNLKEYYEVKTSVDSVELENNKTKGVTVKNKQQYIQVSGYVWEDKQNANKQNTRDNLYTSDVDKLVPGVTVKLRDSSDSNKVIKTTTTGSDGKYIFKKVKITNLGNYYIEFEYNGLKYESVTANTSKANGSKAKENATVRTNFNKSYSTITAGQEKNDKNTIGYSIDDKGTITNKLTYNSGAKGTYKSTLVDNTGYTVSSAKDSVAAQNSSKGVSMTATTTETKYKLKWSSGTTLVDDVNLGMYLRDQPDLAIATDIDRVYLDINGYTHTYEYNQRNTFIKGGLAGSTRKEEEMLLDGFSVIAKNKSGRYRDMTYDRTIYDSYIAYTKNDESNSNRLRMYVTYKIVVKNESTVAYVNPKYLRNYADPDLTFYSSYIIEGNESKEIKWNKKTDLSDKTRNVWESDEISTYIKSGGTRYIYLTYELSTKAISELASLKPNGGTKRVLSNTTEIKSYMSYDSKQNAYAGIDKDSAPGNIKYGDTSTYEDDTDSAPPLQIVRGENPTIKGKVFEDATTNKDKEGRLGDGKYDSGNNTVSGVQTKLTKYDDTSSTPIKLYTLDDSGRVVVTDASVTTPNNGEYTFKGIVPGEYVVKYTYGTIGSLATKTANNSVNVTTQDYKSTIVTNSTLKYAVSNTQGSEYWYQDSKLSNYSSAVDDWEARKKINNNLKNITYSVKTNYESNKDQAENHSIVASTGKMDFAIEDTKNQVTTYDYKAPSRTYNIKFGIAERARQSLELTKDISYVKVTLATGGVLVEGDPRKDLASMNYVTYPKNGKLKIELDNDIMQGAILEIQYTISVENKSESDYNTENYYKYGTIGDNDKPVALKITNVIDYVDERLSTDYTDSANKGDWKLATKDELKKYVSDDVFSTVQNRKNTVINNCDITVNRGKKEDLVAVKTSKIMTPSEDLSFNNYAETVGVSNDVGRFYSESKNGTLRKITPGNFNLQKSSETHESDDDNVGLAVVPSTGDNSIVYYIVGISCLIIITTGIILIKKKVL